MIASAITRRYVQALARARACNVARSGLGDQAELAHEAEIVQASPALHDEAVADPPDVDPGQADGAARWGHSEDLSLLRAARREDLDHQVAFFDVEADVAVPVGERGTECGRSRAHALPAGGEAHGRVVIDVVPGEVFVDGAEVALGEQGVDERSDDVLVLADSVHARSLQRADQRRYPNNLGFAPHVGEQALRFNGLAQRTTSGALPENWQGRASAAVVV